MTDFLAKVPKVADYITSRELDGEFVLMNLKTLKTYALNETASSIWKSIDKNMSVLDIIDKISADYEISRDLCQSDIIETFNNFKDEHLIIF